MSKLPQFRTIIGRSFFGFSTVVITGLALLLFGTNKMTEDAALRHALATVMDQRENSVAGVFFGGIDEMPEVYRVSLRQLPTGYSEIEEFGREGQVLKRVVDHRPRYALILLGSDPSSVPFFLVLAGWVLSALVAAALISWVLARKFSRPVEQMVLSLRQAPHSNVAVPEAPMLQVAEFSQLYSELELFMQRQAQQLERETSFASNVAHELRNPITALQGALELLRTSDDERLRGARLDRMDRALRSVHLTTETLLRLARNEQQMLALPAMQSAQQDYTVVLNQMLTDMLAAEDIRYDPELGLQAAAVPVSIRVSGYPQHSDQWPGLVVALQALVTNARQHTVRGKIDVEVASSYASVTDTGSGIAADLLQQLQTKQSPPGHFGVALVHRICDRFGWELQLKSPCVESAESQAMAQQGACVRINFTK